MIWDNIFVVCVGGLNVELLYRKETEDEEIEIESRGIDRIRGVV
jgi:hypothetical protein